MLLADFAARVAFGLAFAALIGSRRVPRAYFRTICLVLLGLATLAVASSWRGGEAGGSWPWREGLAVAGAYVGAAAWMLGRERMGAWAMVVVAVSSSVHLAAISATALDAAGRLGSGFLMGAMLAAMLLGHQYLTAPATAIGPLRRAIGLSAAALGIRVGLASLALGMDGGPSDWLFPTLRWGVGLAGPAVAVALAWKAAEIRSTQSATGILFVALGFVLTGELAAMAGPRGGSAIVRSVGGDVVRWN